MISVSLKEWQKASNGKTTTLHQFTSSSKHVFLCTYSCKVSSLYTLTYLIPITCIECPHNVVVVHCNAGKGRTGTLISCFLMFSGLADNAKDAITYYGWKRFTHGRGVTQPSQVRYVYYFEEVYKKQIKSPILKCPNKIIIYNTPDVGGSGKCKPYIEIVNGSDFSLVNNYSSYFKLSIVMVEQKQLEPAII